MKPLFPSTPGELSITVRRKTGKVVVEKHFAKFSYIKYEVDELIRDLNTRLNPVIGIDIHFTYPTENKK